MGDGGPAQSARCSGPHGVAVDTAGRVLTADTFHARIRRLDPDDTITTIAGTGASRFSGDGGPAIDATFRSPDDVTVDGAGRVVIADSGNKRVRRIELDGTITTIAGTGTLGFSGEGVAATTAPIAMPIAVVVDDEGRALLTDADASRVWRIEPDGTLVAIAGTGENEASGDGGPATSAALGIPQGLALDPEGRVVISEGGLNRIRGVALDGTITTVAGTGFFG